MKNSTVAFLFLQDLTAAEDEERTPEINLHAKPVRRKKKENLLKKVV